MALQLSVGGDVFISGFSAGVVHGLRQMPKRIVECTIGEDRRATMPAWGRVHLTSWVDSHRDVMVRPDGLRVATPLRALFRLAAVFNDHRFQRAAEDAWHRQLVTPEAAADYLAAVRRSGRTGVTRFEHWLERMSFQSKPSQSGLEQDVVDAIVRAGLPEPVRQLPLILPSTELIHVDMAWPDVRLGVEPGDSWWHGGDLRRARRSGSGPGVRRDRLAHRPSGRVRARGPGRVRAAAASDLRRAPAFTSRRLTVLLRIWGHL